MFCVIFKSLVTRTRIGGKIFMQSAVAQSKLNQHFLFFLIRSGLFAPSIYALILLPKLME
jgi:hypothetical protein